LFLVFPPLLVLAAASERKRAQLLAKLVAARLADRLAGTVSITKRRAKFAFALVGLALAIVALARPQWGFTWEESKRKGRDVIVAIDTSRSMLADDVKPNRLMRAKLAAQTLIGELSGDRVGVVAFAGTAFLQAPLTVDYVAALNALKELDTEIIPQGGTNLEGALRAAVDAFGKGESENRALIVISDGEELDTDAAKAAGELQGKVRVFSVGVGTEEGALIPVRTARGGTAFVKDDAGNVVRTKLEEMRLRGIAEATGGFYLRLQAGRAEMQQIVRDGLGKMTEQDIDARLSRRPIERYQWPLAGCIALVLVSMLLGDRRGSAKVRAASALALFFLLPLAPAQARNEGVEAYEQKKYDEASAAFAKQQKLKPNSLELQFNQGAAAYKAGKYEDAAQAFLRALTSSDLRLKTKAAHNLGNTYFQRGAKQSEKENKIQEWKNAIQLYDQALLADAKNEDAAYNRELVRKLIEDLEKNQPKQDQQKDDQQKKDEQKKDQEQKQDQQNNQGGQGQKDEEKKDQSGQGDKGDQKDQQGQGNQPKPGQGKDEKDPSSSSQPDEKKDQGDKGEPEKKDGQSQGGKDEQSKLQNGDQKNDGEGQQSEKPEPQPGEAPPKKEGELKSAGGQPGDEKEKADAAEALADAQAAAEGKMTEQQAVALFESLKNEDEKVRLYDPKQRRTPKTLKDW
jgi:Ca-activated chloride channel family protein